ncbi:VanZ family protein [Brevibacillus humidisoli]|uniref:VanZ family protein n=1 Tax=Brevibacillus humidisoli TaxID=2895522 RepID=UPI001E4C9A7F|nr:VanZ family protein [Brevibacillus humidisoli]UFJ39785.1 VanZ family protein [Brevibacillus humidisoli]
MSKKALIDLSLLVLVMAAIYIASSMPYEQQDLRKTIANLIDEEWVEEKWGAVSFPYGSREISVAEHGAAGFIEFFIRKGAHFFGFALVAFLLYRVLNYWLQRRAAMLLSGFLAICTAALDEWHQTFTPNRTGMAIDVVLDAAGVLFTLVLLLLAHRRA